MPRSHTVTDVLDGAMSKSARNARLRAAVGTAVHAALRDLARTADRTSITADTVIEQSVVAARAVRSSGTWSAASLGVPHVAPLIASGCRLFPPPVWRFVDVDDIDLAWQHEGTGAVIFDEIKTGTLWTLGRTVTDQADRYVVAGAGQFGDRFDGVRVMLLTAPLRSRLIRNVGRSEALPDTDLWFGYRAPWEPAGRRA